MRYNPIMTEAEWLACADPERMLSLLTGRATERKLRLFLVACARSQLPPSPDEAMTEALAVAERYADGCGSRYDLARARKSLKEGHAARVRRWSPRYTDHIRSVPAWHAAREGIVRAAGEGAGCCAWSSTRHERFGTVAMTYPADELAKQAGFLRDIFGNPFNPAPFDARWATPAVAEFARTIYDDRAYDRMFELAGALEKAGCTSAEALEHCRSGREHVRGCWVVDLILGKK